MPYTSLINIDNNTLYDNQHFLGLFNYNNLEFIHSFILEHYFDLEPTFDSMISLKDNVCVIAYSLERNLVHIILKTISIDKDKNFIMEDYINDVLYFNINEDLIYEFNGGNAFRNNLFKINENEFVMLINAFKNDSPYSNFNSDIVLYISIYII